MCLCLCGVTLNVYTVIIRINAAAFINFFVVKVRRLFEGGVYSRAALIAHFVKKNCELMNYSKLNLTNFNTEPKKLRIKSRRIST